LINVNKNKIELVKINDVHMKVIASQAILNDLKDAFTFFVPGYKFMPAYRNRIWDGKIRLLNSRNGYIYIGLLNEIKEFCRLNEYDLEVHDDLDTLVSFSLLQAKELYDSLKLPDYFEERDFQLESFAHCVKHQRSFFVSPTGSGKSLIIYMLMQYYMDQKILIIVDSLNLLMQMFSDFKEYGFDSDNEVHLISSGKDKYSDKRIIVSTWQSAVKQDQKWFNQFGMVIGDEAHKYKAKSLVKIMESLKECPLKFGFTGSTDGSETNILVLQGLFGSMKQLVTTKELQDDGTLATW